MLTDTNNFNEILEMSNIFVVIHEKKSTEFPEEVFKFLEDNEYLEERICPNTFRVKTTPSAYITELRKLPYYKQSNAAIYWGQLNSH
jgi:hypothetical protein